MTRLVYHGVLAPNVVESVERMSDKYPFVLEVRHYPYHPALDILFADRTWVQNCENCMGQEYQVTHTGVPLGYVSRNFADNNDRSGFLMIPDRDAYDRILEAWPDLVIDAIPFKTSTRGPKTAPTRDGRSMQIGALIGFTFAVVLIATFVGVTA